jgi:hypothetical protein
MNDHLIGRLVAVAGDSSPEWKKSPLKTAGLNLFPEGDRGDRPHYVGSRKIFPIAYSHTRHLVHE